MKKVNQSGIILLAFVAALFFTACNKEKPNVTTNYTEPDLPQQTYNYASQPLPKHAPQLNGINNHVATLGRVLFYDKILSVNNSVACASCHFQQLAFSDGQATSMGFTGRKTSRNSMAIFNTYINNGFFWDLRESSLKSMVIRPVQDHIEMGFDSIDRTIIKIKNTNYYPALFAKAFGTENVDVEKIQVALTQYLNSMVSFSAKYDVGMEKDFSNFNAKEELGKMLFTEKLHCSQCNALNSFGGSGWIQSANIGLDEEYKDQGIQQGEFKIPSLRNIALTAPYMHDGRFKTLEEVVEHYNTGVKSHIALHWTLMDHSSGALGPKKLNLTRVEKEALIAFLHTLTDEKFINNPMFSDPFLY